MCKKTEICGCRVAVTRVYRELKERSIPEISAFNTAAKIFRLHHPEVAERESHFTVAKWLG